MHAVNLHGAISHEGRDLTAQLAAGACLTQTCMAETLYVQPENAQALCSFYCEGARQNGSMAVLVHILDRAVKVGLRFVAPQQML